MIKLITVIIMLVPSLCFASSQYRETYAGIDYYTENQIVSGDNVIFDLMMDDIDNGKTIKSHEVINYKLKTLVASNIVIFDRSGNEIYREPMACFGYYDNRSPFSTVVELVLEEEAK